MPNMRKTTPNRISMALAACGMIAASGATASAQSLADRAREIAMEQQARQRFPARDNAALLMRTMNVEFTNQPVSRIIDFIARNTGADIEPMYISDRNLDGLDPDQIISFRVRNGTALSAIEILLDKATMEFDTSGGNSWQFDRAGTLVIGPKSRLNRAKRIEIYSVLDLVTELPTYDNAPEFDLNQILQASRGGGGQSPFQQTGDDDVDRIPISERIEELIDILTALVEPEQWVRNGGDAASIRFWQGNLIVEAPDYVHRGLAGYNWWPRGLITSRVSEAPSDRPRRWVSLGVDPQFSRILGIEQQPISAVVGGQIIRSGGGGG
jgi:hypothetical protein